MSKESKNWKRRLQVWIPAASFCTASQRASVHLLRWPHRMFSAINQEIKHRGQYWKKETDKLKTSLTSSKLATHDWKILHTACSIVFVLTISGPKEQIRLYVKLFCPANGTFFIMIDNINVGPAEMQCFQVFYTYAWSQTREPDTLPYHRRWCTCLPLTRFTLAVRWLNY